MTAYNGFITAHQSLDLHKGFEFIADMARTELKRELIKPERDRLLKEFIKACNRQQMVCLPDQTKAPILLCAGDLYDQTEGSLTRYKRLCIRALKRPLTDTEWRYLKPQYSKATRGKRAEIVDSSVSWRAGIERLKAMALGECSKYGKNGHNKAGLFLDPLVKAGVISKDYSRSFGDKAVNVFNYKASKDKLKADLKAGKLQHKEYNGQLKALRQMKADILKEIEQGYSKALRNIHDNSNHFHVQQNIKGSIDTSYAKGKDHIEDRQSGTMKGIAIDRVKATPNSGIDNLLATPDHWLAILTHSAIPRALARELIKVEREGGEKATLERALEVKASRAKADNDRHEVLASLGV